MRLDYRQHLRPRARYPWAPWLAASLCLMAAVWLVVLVMRDAAQTSRWQAAVQAAQARRAVRPPPPPSRAVQEEQRRWDALAAERAFSWYPVFRALEGASSADIELLEFVPEKATRKVALRGEARSEAALMDYVAALSSQPALEEVYLAHQKNINRSGMALVVFEIRAGLRQGVSPAGSR